MKKRFLVLENGMVFEGKGFGYDGDATGELVFNTTAGGYTEILTDPSYYGQIVMQTFPLIGNFGLCEEDFENTPVLFGYIVREYCTTPSNFRCEMTLEEFLVKHKIPGICDIDTRYLTEIIRDNGAMNACITDEVTDKVKESLKKYRVASDCTKKVSTKKSAEFAAEGEEKYKVALIDFGVTKSLIASLTKKGCRVITFPYNTTAEDILKVSPDGIMLSNGPGDPVDNSLCIEQIKKLLGIKPIFGVGMGHQLTALALGGKTVKMKHGHRGGNPVKNVETGRVFITSQNHGYMVDIENIPEGAVLTHVNVNDGTCEGINYPSLKAFTLQFPPEACPGPTEAMHMTEKFCKMMEDEKVCR